MPETTKIIIAQRILSGQDANMILVIEKGNIVQKAMYVLMEEEQFL